MAASGSLSSARPASVGLDGSCRASVNRERGVGRCSFASASHALRRSSTFAWNDCDVASVVK